MAVGVWAWPGMGRGYGWGGASVLTVELELVWSRRAFVYVNTTVYMFKLNLVRVIGCMLLFVRF